MEYIPPAPGQESFETRGEMFRALDALTRRLEDLFGPDPAPRDHVSALPVERVTPPSPPQPTEVGESTPGSQEEQTTAKDAASTEERPYTLGQLIDFLDSLELNRQFHRQNQQEQLRRDPVHAALNSVYAAALRWQPDEHEMPGIRRIELLCDLEVGEPEINAAKVRRLRARLCQQQGWQPAHTDRLGLGEVADLLEGIQRVPLDELKRAGQNHLHHGFATLDMIGVGEGKEIQVTGLSCKVIAGTTPTACPDANPVLPPSMLPLAEQAIRRLYPLPPNTTVHWVGHDTGVRSRCRCHPNAPFTAPFDQHRWVAVSPTSEHSTAGTPVPSPANDPVPAQQVSSVRTTATVSSPFTVGDIRDFLIFQAKLAAYRAGLKALDPMKVLATSWFPNAAPMVTAEVLCALTPPEAPRLTNDVAWTLATYRRIAESARAAGRGAPDESDLMGLVGYVAERSNRTIEELLQLPVRDFETVADPPGQTGARDRRNQHAGEGDGESIPQPNGAPPATNGPMTVADPVLDEAELSVLEVLRDRHPLLLKNVDIEQAAKLSKRH